MEPTRWQPDRTAKPNTWPHPPMLVAIGRGLLGRCPGCGKSRIFNGYLRVNAGCSVCGTPLGLARADDAPPYFTILITGHIVVPLLFMTYRASDASDFTLGAIFVPLTIGLALALLRPIKGGTVGLMLNLNMLKSDIDAP